MHLPADSVPTSSDIHRIFDSLDVKIAMDEDVIKLSAEEGMPERIVIFLGRCCEEGMPERIIFSRSLLRTSDTDSTTSWCTKHYFDVRIHDTNP